MSSDHNQICVCYDLLIASHTSQIFYNPFFLFKNKIKHQNYNLISNEIDHECFNNIALITCVYNRAL